MKQATKLIHAGEGVDTGATPSLTTPIYETSTFVFDSVADVDQVPGRQAQRLSLFPLRESDGRGGRAEAGGGRRRRGVVAVQQRHGGDLDGADHAAQERRRDPVLQRRSTAARFTSSKTCCRSSASRTGSSRIDELGERRLGDRPEDEDRLVRVADQSDAALRGRARGRGGVQEGRRAVGDRQHLRQPDQSAGAVDGHRPVDAKLHEVPRTATATSPAACCRDRRR